MCYLEINYLTTSKIHKIHKISCIFVGNSLFLGGGIRAENLNVSVLWPTHEPPRPTFSDRQNCTKKHHKINYIKSQTISMGKGIKCSVPFIADFVVQNEDGPSICEAKYCAPGTLHGNHGSLSPTTQTKKSMPSKHVCSAIAMKILYNN